MWQEAAETDESWQFLELMEDDPEAAEALWNNMRLEIMVNNRLAINPNISVREAILDAMTIIDEL